MKLCVKNNPLQHDYSSGNIGGENKKQCSEARLHGLHVLPSACRQRSYYVVSFAVEISQMSHCRSIYWYLMEPFHADHSTWLHLYMHMQGKAIARNVASCFQNTGFWQNAGVSRSCQEYLFFSENALNLDSNITCNWTIWQCSPVMIN